LITTSDGEKQDNPRYTTRYAEKLAYLQRKLSEKKKSSNNRAKVRQKIGRLHAKIADSRLDNLHKLPRRLVDENQVICVESLAVKNMIKNPILSKPIADASWGGFIHQLKYKAKWADRRTVAEIDRWFPSSKRCSNCGFVAEAMPLNIRTWDCPDCGTMGIDRDINAVKNIKTAGLAGLACGATRTGPTTSAVG
jgi:putative transposase